MIQPGLKSIATYLLMTMSFAFAQSGDDDIFKATRSIRENAEAVQAPLLSPGLYADGIEKIEKAERDLAKGKSTEAVNKTLDEATTLLNKSIMTAKIAALPMGATIESRDAARTADAPRLAASDCEHANELLDNATRSLEKGKLEVATKRGEEANDAYRLAELNAIRNRILTDARILIGEAERLKVGKTAPVTINKARQLLADADAAIVSDRTQAEEPIALAARAGYEARHAMAIHTVLTRVRNQEITAEDIILGWEKSMAAIAVSMNIDPDFAASRDPLTKDIIDRINAYQQTESDLQERDRQVRGLEEEIRELDDRLGGASQERTSLVLRLEQQDRVREQFAQVEAMFLPSEAIVLRDTDSLILRLVGLNFASNSSTLKEDTRALMDKIETAISIFPRCSLVIEGHTDAQGNTQNNMRLSEARAESVAAYMITNMRLPEHRIKATGYGDTRPISSNKTAEGRKKNRRIDLIIYPQTEIR
jgi:OOP family OmpA-OmpF porin